MKINLIHSRDTKGTHLFATEDPAAPIKSVYVKKGHFPDGTPKAIVLTVEVVK
jgi:hypothetical protein